MYSRCASLRSKFIKEATVSYIKAEEILPEELIRQIQEKNISILAKLK